MRRGVISLARRVATTGRVAAVRKVALRPVVAARWMSSNEDKELEARIRAADSKVVEAESKIKEDVALPTKVTGASGPFAARLYRDSVRSGGFEANCKALNDIANALAGMDPFVRRVFASSSYAPEDCWEALFLLSGGTKLDSFDSLSETARNVIVEDKANLSKFQEAQKLFSGISASEDVSKFLGALCEAGRLDLFAKSRTNFFKLVMAAGNGVEVRVVSAVELSAAQTKKVESILPNFLDGATPIVSFAVDPTVLGGVQIQVGNTVAEASADAVLRQVCQTFE